MEGMLKQLIGRQQLQQVRTQLSNLTLASQLLEGELPEHAGQDALATINRSICVLLRMVQQCETARTLIDEDEVRLHIGNIDFARWLSEFGNKIGGILAQSKMKFNFVPPKPFFGVADQTLLQCMLVELISNAAQAGTEVSLSVCPTPKGVRFTVSDNGTGMNAEAIRQAFYPEECDCGGFGLALVRKIVSLHGGQIIPASVLGSGLRVDIVIPLRDHIPVWQLAQPQQRPVEGGFDPVLVGMSTALDKTPFYPDHL